MIYSASGVFVGAWIDKFGPAACIVLACVTSCIGFYMFGMVGVSSVHVYSSTPSDSPI